MVKLHVSVSKNLWFPLYRKLLFLSNGNNELYLWLRILILINVYVKNKEDIIVIIEPG